MNTMDKNGYVNKVTFEEALNRAGFGLYSIILLAVSGLILISMVCIAFASTIIVPSSACELETTPSQRGLLAAAPVIGLILGAVPCGYLTDIYGRRKMLIFSLFSAAVVNALASISVNWIMLLALQFIATFLSAGLFSQAMSIVSESVPMAKRNFVVLLVGSIFHLSQGIMAVLAIPIIPLSFSFHLAALGIYWNSWRTLMLMYSIPSLLSGFLLLFMHESPKFLFNRSRESEALMVLSKIHKMNNNSHEELAVLSIIQEEKQSTMKRSLKETFIPLFKTPLLKNTIIISILFLFEQMGAFVVWLPTIANQFVRILESGEGSDHTLCKIFRSGINIPRDDNATPCALNVTALLLVLAVSTMQCGANVLVSLIINRVGRRNMVMFITAFCGLCAIMINLVPNAIGSAVMYLIFLLGIVVIGLYSAIVVALFPTYLRALAVSFTMMVGRIGTFASIQILNFLFHSNCEVSFYVYGAIFALSAVVAGLLVDDRLLQRQKSLNTKL